MNQLLLLPTDLKLARYCIRFSPEKSLPLPEFKETMLRGGLGLALKQGACIRPTGVQCQECAAPEICAYAYLFGSKRPPEAEVLRAASDVPAPYIFAAQREQQLLAASEPFDFTLTLVGGAIRYLPYLVAALRLMGIQGLGQSRIRCHLQAVYWLAPDGEATALFVGPVHGVLRAQPAACTVGAWAAVGATQAAAVTIHFESPTTLKHNGDILHDAPPFHVLIRTLLRRVSSLSYFHGGQRWETDYRGWIERAEAVTTTDAAVEWHDGSRYSTRTQRRMPLGGLVGTVTYSGDLTPFLPLLRLGELIHVGKNAVFGNGRFVIADC